MIARGYLRKFGRILGFFLLAMVASIGAYGAVQHFFSITTIEVVGEGIEVSIQREKLAKNLLFFASDRVAGELLRENPHLSSLEIQKKFPHTLVIVARVRRPIARLSTGDRTLELDRSGIVLSDAMSQQTLPQLNFSTPSVHIGQKLDDPRILQSLTFIEHVGSIGTIQTITSYDSTSLRAKVDEIDILFPQDKLPPETGATLQTLIAGFRIKGTQPARIDLRFSKPIITY